MLKGSWLNNASDFKADELDLPVCAKDSHAIRDHSNEHLPYSWPKG
jgi:hypothetical protein